MKKSHSLFLILLQILLCSVQASHRWSSLVSKQPFILELSFSTAGVVVSPHHRSSHLFVNNDRLHPIGGGHDQSMLRLFNVQDISESWYIQRVSKVAQIPNRLNMPPLEMTSTSSEGINLKPKMVKEQAQYREVIIVQYRLYSHTVSPRTKTH